MLAVSGADCTTRGGSGGRADRLRKGGVLSARTTRPAPLASQSKKLGLKQGCSVALIDAPVGFVFEDPPPGCTVVRKRADNLRAPKRIAPADVTLAFVRDGNELDALVQAIGSQRERITPVWLCWPRRAGGHESDLTDGAVRAAGLALGLVDTKVAAVNEDWSALRFAARRA